MIKDETGVILQNPQSLAGAVAVGVDESQNARFHEVQFMNIGEARQRAYQNGFRSEAEAKARPWKIGDKTLPINQIARGDSVELLNALEPGWVDLVFADPPFNIGYLYHGYDDQKSVKEYLDFSRNWMKAVYRALKPNGSFYLAIGDEFAADLAVIARREIGFHMRNWIVWHYTFGQQTKKKFAKSHTHILYFTKEKPEAGLTNMTFNADEIRVKSARQTVYADTRANSKGKLPDDTWFLRPQEAAYFERGFKEVPLPKSTGEKGIPNDEISFFDSNSSTWNISRVCGTFKEREGWHGCQMPIGVLDRIIKASSNEGDIVLDPFNGSGTTCVSAALLGRRFVGFDQSDEYVAFARKRLEHALNVKEDGSGDVHDKKRTSKKETPTDAFGRARVKRKGRNAAA
ncbi:MAG: yhdJ 1 [Phycisphaerales bacterium]|nr:yhdJ 1 [Phycisphaerales bacterium]